MGVKVHSSRSFVQVESAPTHEEMRDALLGIVGALEAAPNAMDLVSFNLMLAISRFLFDRGSTR